MARASFVRSNFSGGEWSQWAQGRYHDPKYQTALNTCSNFIPVETEGLVRRPGFTSIFGGFTRGANPARLLKFDFENNAPYTMEFTDGNLRLLANAVPGVFQPTSIFIPQIVPVSTNDGLSITSISNANPCVVTLNASPPWGTGDTVFINLLGTQMPQLQNRLFTATVSGANITLADAVTGANIDSTSMGSYTSGAGMNRLVNFTTPYVGNSWASLRSVQSDNFALLLHPNFTPWVLGVAQQPTGGNFAKFAFNPATLNDGPYLDPLTNGAIVNPSIATGIVQLSVNFPAYVATTSYAIGAFVTSAGANYVSLVDQNINFTPASNPSKWAVTPIAAAINNGAGFTQADIGRLIRLFSEPAAWAAGTTYATGNVVSYNPTGLPGQTTYWGSLVSSNTGNIPGADLTHWQVLQLGGQVNSPAIWTWGKITQLINFISTGGSGGGSSSIVTQVGDMTGGGGLSSAFDSNFNKARSACATKTATNTSIAVGQTITFRGFVGAQIGSANILSATVTPPNNHGLASVAPTGASVNLTGTVYLYGANSSPGSYNAGTLLGSAVLPSKPTNINAKDIGVSPVTIVSNNTATFYTYVWVVIEMVTKASVAGTVTTVVAVCQEQLATQLTITGTSTSGVNVELLGPPLLYTTPIANWRLGVYSGVLGWPTCGTLAEGRIWLSGAVPNRVDSTTANGFINNNGVVSLNFAPTDQYGNVLASSGISAVFNAPDANPILWMLPDAQGIIAGTQASEWLISAPGGAGFAPTNIAVRRTTRIGSANIEPVKTEHTVVLAQKFQRNVMEYFADVFSGKFSAPKLTVYVQHLTTSGIAELAYQQERVPLLWIRLNSGSIACCLYKRDTLMTSSGPSQMGWASVSLASGSVTSICTGSSVNGSLDALTMVSNIGSNFYVNTLADVLDEGARASAASYLDYAIVPSSTTSTNSGSTFGHGALTLNGLWPLNGQVVTAWLGGLDCGDYTVSNGSIAVPYGDGVSVGTASGLFTANFVSTGITANGNTLFDATQPFPMSVGLTYNSQGKVTLPNLPQETGAREGPGFGKLRRVHYIMAQFENSAGVSIGTSFGGAVPTSLYDLTFPSTPTIDTTFTGIWRDQYLSEYSFSNRISWIVSRPYPCNLLAVGASLETQDV